jgi:hypothetical protein
MPTYSLVPFVNDVKYGWSLQGLLPTELFPTQKLLTAWHRNQGRYVRYRSEIGTTETEVKVPKCVLSVSNSVGNLRQWGGKLRSSYPLKKA